MNIENMRKLRTRMRSRKNPVKFNMNRWFEHNGSGHQSSPDKVMEIIETHVCGTAACLAGQAAIMYLQENDGKLPSDMRTHEAWIHELGRRYLGLSSSEGDKLFFGRWWAGYQIQPLSYLTKAEAIGELTRLIGEEEAR